jgi:hypothetical protein
MSDKQLSVAGQYRVRWEQLSEYHHKAMQFQNCRVSFSVLLAILDTAVFAATDYRLLRLVLKDFDKQLAEHFIELKRAIRVLNPALIDTDPFRRMESIVAHRIEGVQRLQAGEDNGETLRHLLADPDEAGDLFLELTALVESLDRGGRTPSKGKKWLRHNWPKNNTAPANSQAYRLRQALLARKQLTTAEQEALDILSKTRTAGQWTDYRRKLDRP